MTSLIAVAPGPGSIKSITSPHRRGLMQSKPISVGRTDDLCRPLASSRFRLPHPPSKIAAFRQGLRHLLEI